MEKIKEKLVVYSEPEARQNALQEERKEKGKEERALSREVDILPTTLEFASPISGHLGDFSDPHGWEGWDAKRQEL